MRLKSITKDYLIKSTRVYTRYDGSVWVVTDTIAMRLPSDYVQCDQHMLSSKFIPDLIESSGFYSPDSFMMAVDIESWRPGLTCKKNTDLPLNDQYKYQSKLVKLFHWRLMDFTVSLSSGILFLHDIYNGDLCGIILPVKIRKKEGEKQ